MDDEYTERMRSGMMERGTGIGFSAELRFLSYDSASLKFRHCTF